MSTAIGMVTKDDQIIFGADVQATINKSLKSQVRKLKVNKKNDMIYSVVGLWDEAFYRFDEKLQKGKIDINKTIKKKFFQEFLNLNLGRTKGEVYDEKKSNRMIFAVYSDKPKLYYCYPFGKVKVMCWVAIGSGDEQVEKYINSKSFVNYVEKEKYLDLDLPTSKQARRLVYNSLVGATKQDIYSSGMDFAVFNKNGTKFLENKFSNMSQPKDKKILNRLLNL